MSNTTIADEDKITDENIAETAIVNEADSNLLSVLPSEALAELTPAKRRMIFLYLTGQYTLRKIAEIIGVHEATIYNWMMQEQIQVAIKEIQKREAEIIDSSIKTMNFKALQTINDLMDSPMDAVRFQASKDVLDRSGHKAITEMKIDKTVTTIEKQLRDLAEMAIDDVEVIDITDIVDLVQEEYEKDN
jgi:hypothetical protein